jgi:hypothetical protein
MGLPRLVLLWALLLLGAMSASRGSADPPEEPAPQAPTDELDDPTPPSLVERIRVAIEKGAKWLEGRALKDGSWGDVWAKEGTTYNGTNDVYVMPSGPTALAIYTLLKCDVPEKNTTVKRGLQWLQKRNWRSDSAYELSMSLLAATATADPFKRTRKSKPGAAAARLTGPTRKWAEDLLELLLTMRAPNGWRYWGARDTTVGGPEDLSSTQLAALALLAAERCGLAVDPEAWVGILRFTLQQQERSGPSHPRAVFPRPPPGAAPAPADPDEPTSDRARGFAYILGRASIEAERVASGGMTACGVGCLMAARYSLSMRAPKVWALEDADAVQQSIYDGLAWLDKNWSPWLNPIGGDANYHIYYLYSVERAMDLVGANLLGKHLWYAEMAEELLKRQEPSGRWVEGGSAQGPATDVLDTCFALLFLDRATMGGIPMPSVTGGSD